eukprot:COSAG01_NODE_8563_length_2740_cov_4.096554_7_plen_72_part_00
MRGRQAMYMLGVTTDEGMQLRPLQLGALGLICTIAFWWTVPWDNYLVKHQVWGYGASRVMCVFHDKNRSRD